MTNSFTVTSQPYVNFGHVCEIADEGVEWNYNRQLDSDAVRRNTPTDALMIIEHHFQHEHRFMQRCEPHMRLVFEIQGDFTVADVPMAYFDSLPRVYVLKQRERVLLMAFLDDDGRPIHLIKQGHSKRVDEAIEFLGRRIALDALAKLMQQELSVSVSA